MQQLPIEMDTRFKTNARRTVKLTDHHSLCPIDHKRSLRRHERDFSHVDLLLLCALLILVTKGHIERRAVGLAFALTFDGRHLRLAKLVTDKVQARLFLKPKNRKKFPEHRLQSHALATRRFNLLLEELIIGVDLKLDEIRGLDGFLEFAEVNAFRHGGRMMEVWCRSKRGAGC